MNAATYPCAPAWVSRSAAVALPTRRTDVLVELLDNEAVVVDPLVGRTYRLNSTAHFVWERCDGAGTVHGLAERLAGEYGVDAERALDDVEGLILVLAELSLLKSSGEE